MRDGWVETTLGDVAEITIGRTPPRKDPRYWTVDLERPFCTIAELEPLTIPKREGVTALAEEEGKAKRFPQGSLLMSFKLTIGRVGFAGVDLFPNEAIARLKPLSENTFDRYLALALEAQNLEEYAGRAVKGKTLTREAIKAIPITLPPLQEQLRIVDLISSIDHAIRAAEMTNEKAQSAAREFLRQVFFTQPIGRRSTLGDIASYLNGYPFKPEELGSEGLPVIRIKQLLNPSEVPDRTTVTVPHRHLLSDGDLIFSWSGTLATRVWNRGPGILNQHLFKVVEKDGIDRAWLRLALEHAIEQLETMTHGTTMKHITKAKMMPHPVVVPPLDTQQELAARYEGIEQVVDGAYSVVERLRKLRAEILADLVSGTHEIPASYDRFLEEAS